MTFPRYNEFREDTDYLESLNYSLSEIGELFKQLESRSDYHKLIGLENRKQLRRSYAELFSLQPSILLEENDQELSKRLAASDSIIRLYRNIFREDTSRYDIGNVTSVVEFCRHNAAVYLDSLDDQNGFFSSYKTGKDLLDMFSKKFGGDSVLNKQINRYFGSMSWYFLILNKADSSIACALRSLEVIPDKDRDRNWAYTNLALGYLLNNEFTKASEIYRRLKDKTMDDGRSFRAVFKQDFEDLTGKGIISESKDRKIFEEVEKIKRDILRSQ